MSHLFILSLYIYLYGVGYVKAVARGIYPIFTISYKYMPII